MNPNPTNKITFVIGDKSRGSIAVAKFKLAFN